MNQQNGMIQQLMNCLLNHPIRARSKKYYSINRESTRTAICQKTLLSIINQSLHSKRFLKQKMAGEFRLHQLFSEIEKEEKLIQERKELLIRFWKKLPKDTPLREAELRLKALREEQNSLVREMTLKHRGNGSEGNSTGGIIRGAQGEN